MPSHEYVTLREAPGSEQLNKIITYLCGNIDADQFFYQQRFQFVRFNISLVGSRIRRNYRNLNLELLDTIKFARGKEYSIEVDKIEMFKGRVVNWDGLGTAEIVTMDVDSTTEHLKSARSEIALLKNEIGRLRVHMQNAATAKKDESADELLVLSRCEEWLRRP